MNRIRTATLLTILAALLGAGCGGSEDDKDGSGGRGAENAKSQLALVAYSTPEVVYDEIIPAFRKTGAGRDVGFKTSFGASGEQSRAVEGGLKADVVSFSIEPDVERLVDAGLVAKDWKSATPTDQDDRAELPDSAKEEIARRVDELLEIVGLAGYKARYPSQLSGGQRQRMALARGLAVEPEVLLLDEPFGALDATVRKELRAWLRRLHDEVHVTTIFVTHDQEEAMDISDQIVVMNEGRIEQVGAPRELYDEPGNEFVMGFIGEVNRLGTELVRPHDLEILASPNGSTQEAQIDRVVHLGFEVRVELTLGGRERIWVQTTRDRAQELELERGQIVFLRKDAARSFAPATRRPAT